MRRHWRSALLLLFSAGVTAAFAFYLFSNADKYRDLLQLSPISLALLFILSFTSPFLNGLINTLMFRSLGANLSFREGFLLAAASTLANQLPVSGGIVAKGVYLKYRYDLSYAKYLSSMLAIFLCTIAVYGLLGLAILLEWSLVAGRLVAPALWMGFGGMGLAVFTFWMPLDRLHLPPALAQRVQQALEGWTIIGRNPVLLLKLLSVQTTMMSLLAVRYWLAFHMLSQNVSISQVILFASATILTNLVSFAPGGLGVREAIVGGIASALGFDIGTSVVAVGLDRLVSTVMIVLVGWISSAILGREIMKVSAKPGDQQM